MYEAIVQKIVYRHGGIREKDVLAGKHTITPTETWNEDHKVLEILESMPDSDGYRRGFQVDTVTMTICG